MKIKKTIAMIMALAFVGTAFMANGSSFAKPSVTAYAAEEELEFEGEVLVDGIDYDVKSNHVVLLDCQDSVKGEVIIPDTIKGRPVTVIRENAFESCSSLEKIELPQSVKEIGDNAFLWCTSLKEVVIPDGVEKNR
ncbi:MAG: leucine-rich repeat domain-containing protein [Ruminococcus sp.]|nr:leucine-rich repeat domain-containing protein [Ruminococcus sp.]